MQGCYFWVKVTPKSHKNACLGFQENRVHLRLRAIPIKGHANEVLIEYLSFLLNISKSKISISKGKTSRLKEVFVQELTLEQVKEKLHQT